MIDSRYFADTVLQADLLVSIPKLKTHHWPGTTLSMKNLFGIVPWDHVRLGEKLTFNKLFACSNRKIPAPES
jgi:uncharacterized protein (DUF362 family)